MDRIDKELREWETYFLFESISYQNILEWELSFLYLVETIIISWESIRLLVTSYPWEKSAYYRLETFFIT